MDSAPSFSLGMTQISASIEDSIPNNADPPKVVDHNVVEDSFDGIMRQEDEVAKDVASSSKSLVRVRHAKRKKKSTTKKAQSVIGRPSLPKGKSYVIKNIPKHPLKFGSSYNSSFVADIKASIGDEALVKFRETIFGHFLDIPHCKFQGQSIKCLMLLELKHNDMDLLHIRHIKGNVLCFSIRDFAVITGLKCTGSVDDFRFQNSTPSRLLEKYFPGAISQVHKGTFVSRFLLGNWDNDEDAVQMAIIYFIHTFLFSQTSDTPISADYFRMVEDGTYKDYPWGKEAYTKLMHTFRQDCTVAKQMYRLSGMPYVLNVWIYECASEVPHDIAVKLHHRIPRILSWEVKGLKPKYDYFMSTIFSEISCSNLVPSDKEIATFALPPIPDDMPSTKHMPDVIRTSCPGQPSNAKKIEASDFEDFTSQPPEHLLRKSKRSCVLSSSPPPKKHKALKASKSIPATSLKQQKIVHFATIIEKKSTKPKSSDVTAPQSSDDKQKLDEDIKGLKELLLKYVDDKFAALESLMVSHHTAMLKAIKDEVNSLREAPATTDGVVNQGTKEEEHQKSSIFDLGDTFIPDKDNHPVQEHGFNDVMPGDSDEDKKNSNDNKSIEKGPDNNAHASTAEASENVAKSSEHGPISINQLGNSVVEPQVFIPDDNENKKVDTNCNALELEPLATTDLKEPQDDEVSKEVVDASRSAKNLMEINQDLSEFSEGTYEAIDTLLLQIQGPLAATPLQTCTDQEPASSSSLLRDSQSPTTLPCKALVLHESLKTPAQRTRKPSKMRQSPFVETFSSGVKGKEKLTYKFRHNHPFEGYRICYDPPLDLISKYDAWVVKGMLLTHARRKPSDKHYYANQCSLGPPNFDFVVASPTTKDWFYLMSQPDRCWNDEHLDVIFYYLRRKSKNQFGDHYKYTTVDCRFKNFIVATHARYYEGPNDEEIGTQEFIDHIPEVSKIERGVTNIIQGYAIPAGMPWHLVDEVYIPVNCSSAFHWVLAVIVLKERLIRVYDSSPGSRRRNPSDEVQKIALMLPTYLHASNIYKKTQRTNWASLDAYKDKKTGDIIGEQHPFKVEYVEGIAQQKSDSVDCGVFVAAFAEYLSDGIPIPAKAMDATYMRKRCAALLWNYGLEKAAEGYKSDNDDPPRPKDPFSAPDIDKLVVLS